MKLEFVFVHLGSEVPEFLKANVEGVARKFSHNKVTLLLDDLNSKVERWAHINDINLVVVRNENIRHYTFHLDHSLNFRNRFWHVTIERIVAFLQYAKLERSGGMLHVESDVLLFKEFPVEILEKEQKLMWMPYNEIRDVAALLYVPQWSEANWLLMQMETQLISNTAHTDMTLLRAIAKEFPEKVDYFPILDNDRVLDNKELKVEFRKKIRAQNRFGANVFDSAAVGMWLFGEDPRNNYGLSRVKSNKTAETSESYVLPHNTNFELDENNCVIFRSSKREKTKLLCIHVHSKDPELFSNEAETIKKYLKRNDKHRGEYYLFFPKVFFELVKGNYTGGTLLKFIAFSPIFIKFTEKIRSRLAKYV